MEDLKRKNEGHRGGNSIRFLLWSLYKEVGKDAFFKALGKELGKTYHDLPRRNGLKSMDLFDDVELEKGVTMINSFRTVSSLLDQLSTHFPDAIALGKKHEALGKLAVSDYSHYFQRSRLVKKGLCTELLSDLAVSLAH